MNNPYQDWKEEEILAHAEAHPEQWTPEALHSERVKALGVAAVTTCSVSYRLLDGDETVRSGDEILLSDAVTWLTTVDRPLIMGERAYGFNPIRRETSLENA